MLTDPRPKPRCCQDRRLCPLLRTSLPSQRESHQTVSPWPPHRLAMGWLTCRPIPPEQAGLVSNDETLWLLFDIVRLAASPARRYCEPPPSSTTGSRSSALR